jgi:repressor LexA
MREIGAQVGLTSPSSVKYQLAMLERKGYLRRDPALPRAIEVVDPAGIEPPLRPYQPTASSSSASSDAIGTKLSQFGPDATAAAPVFVPLVGQIAAGNPILADQLIEDVYTLPKQLVGEGELFMLKVRGDSMIDAAIVDGDWVVIRRQPTAENGQIVAAMLDDEATVKTFKRDKDHVWLLPQNQVYDPILGDHATILGLVVAVLRSL